MAKPTNAEQLRNYVLDSLDKLERKKIDIVEMGVIAKSSETVMSSLKMQLAYASIRQEIPTIPFLQDCHKVDKKIVKEIK